MGLFDKKENEELKVVKDAMLSKFPSLGSTCSKLKFQFSKKVPTAATDGDNVYFNPNFFGEADHNKRVFLMAHEVMHVAFNHIRRGIDKDGQPKNHRIWNIATDAVINSILENNGLKIPEDGVNIPDAINHSADEMYQQLYKQEQEKQQQGNGGEGEGGQGNQGGQSQQSSSSDQQQGQQGQQGQQQQAQQGQTGQQGQQQQNQQGQQGQQSQSGQQGQQQSGQQSGQQGQQMPQNGNMPQNQQGGGQQQGQNQPKGQNAGQQDQQQGNGGANDVQLPDTDEQQGHDSHDMWADALKKMLKKEEDDKKKKEKEKQKGKDKDKDKEKQDAQENQDENNGDGKKQNQNQDTSHLKNPVNGNGTDEEEEAAKFKEQGRSKGEKPQDGEQQEEQDDGEELDEEQAKAAAERLEKEFQEMNDELKKEMAVQIKKQLQEKGQWGGSSLNANRTMGDVGEDKPVLSWKKLLVKEFQKDEAKWSYRRSNRDNFYMPRIEELETYEQSKTEVVLDTSGSIDDALLKGFLRQLKPLLKETKLRVGCFDYEFYGFTEIKTNDDIDHFKARGGGGTNIDCAVRAFTKDKKVNKIVFTDGEGYMPQRDLWDTENCVWVVFDNPSFKAPFGKIIYVERSEMYTNDYTRKPAQTSTKDDYDDEFDM